MTPGELAKIRAAVAEAAAALLAREDNANTTAEILGEELAEAVVETVISSYEEIQAKAYNLIVLGHFRLDDDTSYVAAVGPLSTRAKMRAKEIGERFAWDYKTRRGTGKFVLVPLVRNPAEAWDDVRLSHLMEYEGSMGSITPGVEPSYEPMKFELSDEVRARIASMEEASEPYYGTGKPYEKGPACSCGIRIAFIKGQAKYATCPRHPEGRNSGTEGSAQPGTGGAG